MNPICERFKEWMVLNNLNGSIVNRATSIHKSTISKIVNGERLPSTETLLLIYETYNAPIFWILTGEEIDDLRNIPIMNIFDKLNDKYKDYAVLEMDKLYKMQILDEDKKE